ncbi:MAG: VWA domain-containing protein, partial [Anaerolineales bacterium]|nr:VWA domain-containing protein [Anaerolineales bacterium]
MSKKNGWWAAVILLGLLLSLIGAAPYAYAQDEETSTITAEREVTPGEGLLDDVEFAVTLTLTGNSSLCPVDSVERPADIALVLDHSPSMFWDANANNTKMDLLKEAVIQFLDEVNLQSGADQLAIVEFDSAANIVQPLLSNRAALTQAIDNINEGNGTAIAAGLTSGQQALASSRADASQVLIIITDGQDGGGFLGLPDSSLRSKANDIKAQGIRIITIGLGPDVDEDLLQDLASQPADYHFAPSANNLAQLYADIGSTVASQPLAATDVIVEHRFDASLFELVAGSVSGDNTTMPGIITWAVRDLSEAPVMLSYQLRPLAGGTNNISLGETISYNRCGATRTTDSLPPGLPVAVQLPTATPTPVTPTATPTTTPTPTPTITPTPLPTATPTPVPPWTEQAQTTATALICNPAAWGWCLGILLLLFFLWWLLRLLREFNREENKRDICRWIPWLALPFLLLLLWQLLSAVGFCPVGESVYFWRINPSNTQGEIWVTDRQGLRAASEFEAINRGQNCVGCHTVSNTAGRIAAVTDGGTGTVVVYDLQGDRIDIPPIIGSYMAFSPDGGRLAISTKDQDIVILDIATGRLQPLDGASDPNMGEMMPAWSSDGQTIAFVRGDLGPSSFQLSNKADIYTIPVTGGTPQALSGASGEGMNYYPAYSPDGRWLAFTRHIAGDTTYAAAEAEIFLVPAAGGEQRRLQANNAPDGTPLQNVSNSWPTWSLDGQWLAFNSKRNDASYDLFVTQVDADGNSGSAQPLAGAANEGVFEHLPFWGIPPQESVWDRIAGLWPWLIPFLLIALAYWLCRRLHPPYVGPIFKEEPPREPPSPLPLPRLDPLWQVAPTLIVGVGGTGRWVLTHIKKSLLDGGFGERHDDVHFLLLDTSERETTNQYRDPQGRAMNVSFAGVELARHEILLMGQNMGDVIAHTKDAALEGWFPQKSYRQLGDQQINLSNGTYGRRPMARAGLVDQLRKLEEEEIDALPINEQLGEDKQRQAHELWQALTAASAQVAEADDHNLVRVMVVGSLAGGMSGTLFDVAHLARLAAEPHVQPNEGSIHVEGLFATAGIFKQYASNYPRLQINTISSLLELNRFQMTKNMPFSMQYVDEMDDQSALPDHLRAVCDQLFDDVTLFGANGNPEIGKSSQPWATVFASMADVMAFRLDKATGAGETGEYRSGLDADAETRQGQRGQAVVGTAGSYVYRLPLVDILAIVQARWAQQLLHLFLIGDELQMEPAFDWQQAQLEQTPSEQAQHFLNGAHPAADKPNGLRALRFLIQGQNPLARDVLPLADNEDESDFYDAYLHNALSLILNGSEANPGQLAGRAPRLGYALAFVEVVGQLLSTALETAENEVSGAPDIDNRTWLQNILLKLGFGKSTQQEWQQTALVLSRWLAITKRSQESLRAVRILLIGSADPADGVVGLYNMLKQRRADIEARRSQMDQVAVRRYLWSRVRDLDANPNNPENQIDLADEWTAELTTHLFDHLQRFYWQMTPDGNVYLQVIGTQGNMRVSLNDKDKDSIRQVANEITKLAGVVTADFAKETELPDVLMTQYSSQSREPATDIVRQAWVHAQPHLAPPLSATGAGIDGELVAAVGLPPRVVSQSELKELDTVLADLIKRLGVGTASVLPARIASSDKTAVSVVREYQLLP